MSVTHLNPRGVPSNPGFSQAVVVEGPARTIYVGGQNAVEPDGSMAGADAGEQARRALANLELVLAAAGAGLEHVVSWSILIVDGQPLQPAFLAFQDAWAMRGPPPALTVACVAALANPAFLIEISAIAVVTGPRRAEP
jgi:enamine deaminase RidA (YjgF/YER057c/UK114 family)